MKYIIGFVVPILLAMAVWGGVEVQLVQKLDLEKIGILQPELICAEGESIIIFDKGKKQFVKLGKNLELIKSFGKKGQGPGEFQQVINFGISERLIWIVDASNKLILLDMNGRLVKEIKGDFVDDKLATILEWISPSCSVVFFNNIGTNYSIGKKYYLNKDRNRIELAQIDQVSNSTYYFGQVLIAHGKRRIFLVPDSLQYSLKSFDLQENKWAEKTEKKGYQRVPYSQEERQRMRDKLKRIGSNPMLARMKIKLPNLKPAIKHVIADEHDNLYVMTNQKKGDETRIDMYNKTLKYLGHSCVQATSLSAVSNGRFYTIMQTDESFTLLVYYFN